ncbi:MAG: Gx transporter family protein [Clostridiales bacterium]|nr:Gx transporter family protein [Clostridiales bacterium]
MITKRKIDVKMLVIVGLMAAVAATLSWLENFVPIQAIVPIPGLKFGLANIVTIFAIFYLGTRSTLMIVVIRCLLGSILGGGPIALAFSLTGALFAALIMIILKSGYKKHFSLYGISLAGATMFNVGQVIVAAIVLQDTAIFTYLPILMTGGVVAGLLTAVISVILFKKLNNSGAIRRHIKTSS